MPMFVSPPPVGSGINPGDLLPAFTIVSGIEVPGSGLTDSWITEGIVYRNRERIIIPAFLRTYPANRDIYVDLSATNTYLFTEVLVGGGVAAPVAGAVRVLMLRTSATEIIGVSFFSARMNWDLALGVNTYSRASPRATRNTALGAWAMRNIDTGHTNTAVGNASLAFLTTGHNNVAVGNEAMANATTALENVAVGNFALRGTVAGMLNTAVGLSAMQNAGGNENCAIGYNALMTASGHNNTAIGGAAGQLISTGNNNICIGRWAGGGLETGSNNVIIGQVTGLPMALTDNVIVATGAGAERFRVVANGDMGVGTPTPTARMDINGNTLRLRTARTPATATAPGNAGDICWDAGFIYVCVATNTWRRAALAAW